MALELILKHIGCFVEVLENASTRKVTGWNAESVKRAYKWAAYCEQVAQFTVGMKLITRGPLTRPTAL